jgi:hypothetical protein
MQIANPDAPGSGPTAISRHDNSLVGGLALVCRNLLSGGRHWDGSASGRSYLHINLHSQFSYLI